MEFTVDGTHFSLTEEDVLNSLRGHSPELVHQYSVTVEGQAWPVKQIFSLATRLPHSRFQSQTARRQLKRLGFGIDQDPNGTTNQLSPHSGPPRVEAFDPNELIESDTVAVSVQFTWLSAGELDLDENQRPKFPKVPKLPGLYRFTFIQPNANENNEVYIGESKHLAKRVSQYRNAANESTTQRTSRRLHKQIVKHLAAGNSIEFSIATEVFLGADEEAVNLNRTSARRVAENAAVLLSQLNPNNYVLNIDADILTEEIAIENEELAPTLP